MYNTMDVHLRCQITLENCQTAEDLSAVKKSDHAKSPMYMAYRYPGSLDSKSDRSHLGLPVRFPVQEDTTSACFSEIDRNDVSVNNASSDNWAHYQNHMTVENQNGHGHTFAAFPYHNIANYGMMKEATTHHRTTSSSDSRSNAISDAYGLAHCASHDVPQAYGISAYYSGNRLMPSYHENTPYPGYSFHGYGLDYSDRRSNSGASGQYYYGNTFHLSPSFLNNCFDGNDTHKSTSTNFPGENIQCASSAGNLSNEKTKLYQRNDYSYSATETESPPESVRKAKPRTLKYRTRTDEFPFSFHIRKQEKSMMKKLKELEKTDSEKSKQLMEFYQYQMAYTEREYKSKYQDAVSAFTPTNGPITFDDMEMQVMQIIQQIEERIQAIHEERECARAGSVNICCGEIRKTRLLPKRSVKMLESWFQENISNPYPSRDQTVRLALDCGLTVEQVRKWFANKRNRSRNNRIHMLT